MFAFPFTEFSLCYDSFRWTRKKKKRRRSLLAMYEQHSTNSLSLSLSGRRSYSGGPANSPAKVSYDYYGRFLSTGTSIRTVDRYTYHGTTTTTDQPSTNLWGGWVGRGRRFPLRRNQLAGRFYHPSLGPRGTLRIVDMDAVQHGSISTLFFLPKKWVLLGFVRWRLDKKWKPLLFVMCFDDNLDWTLNCDERLCLGNWKTKQSFDETIRWCDSKFDGSIWSVSVRWH